MDHSHRSLEVEETALAIRRSVTVRRPPIAQHRFWKSPIVKLWFSTKDLKQKRTRRNPAFHAGVCCRSGSAHTGPISTRDSLLRLLAPQTIQLTSAALFALLGQQKRPRPTDLSWASSLRQHFGVDPLIDSQGQPYAPGSRLKPLRRASLRLLCNSYVSRIAQLHHPTFLQLSLKGAGFFLGSTAIPPEI